MRTNVSEKLLKIVDEIDAGSYANLTKLAVLKKWFERPERLSAFAIWVAARAVSRKGKTTGAAAELFRAARKLFSGVDKIRPKLDKDAAQLLHDRLREFQNDYENQRWARVRIVHNWNLMFCRGSRGFRSRCVDYPYGKVKRYEYAFSELEPQKLLSEKPQVAHRMCHW